MPRNGSGTDTIPNSFTPATVISSTSMNANFIDIAAEITNSVAVDGQSTMSGALKAAPGAAATPSMTFGADIDTGIYRKGANQLGFATGGVERGYFDTTGAFILGTNTADAFPAATKMLFQQTAAPTGWTKDLTHDNKALRVVTGAASSGGSVAFTTAFASQAVTGTTDGTAISAAQMPVHAHFTLANVDPGSASNTPPGAASFAARANSNFSTGIFDYQMEGTATAATVALTSSSGSGSAHTHTFTGNAINLAVQYVDLIICSKA